MGVEGAAALAAIRREVLGPGESGCPWEGVRGLSAVAVGPGDGWAVCRKGAGAAVLRFCRRRVLSQPRSARSSS